MMVNSGIAAVMPKNMNVSVIDLNGSGRVFNFDLKAGNAAKIMFHQFFLDRIRVEVKPDGKASIVRYDEGNGIYPTGALKGTARHLQENGAKTLSYDEPDTVKSLERAGIPKGKDIPLDTWKANMPKSESLLAFVDDGK